MEAESSPYTMEEMRAEQEAHEREMNELHSKNKAVLD